MTQAPEALIISKEGSWEDAQIVPLSISHENGYATAVCLAMEEE
jgi:phosphopantetheinyl transferase (holo-ACP synthase)